MRPSLSFSPSSHKLFPRFSAPSVSIFTMDDQGQQPPDKSTGGERNEAHITLNNAFDVDAYVKSVLTTHRTPTAQPIPSGFKRSGTTTFSSSATSGLSEHVPGGHTTSHVGVKEMRSAVDGCVTAGTK